MRKNTDEAGNRRSLRQFLNAIKFDGDTAAPCDAAPVQEVAEILAVDADGAPPDRERLRQAAVKLHELERDGVIQFHNGETKKLARPFVGIGPARTWGAHRHETVYIDLIRRDDFAKLKPRLQAVGLWNEWADLWCGFDEAQETAPATAQAAPTTAVLHVLPEPQEPDEIDSRERIIEILIQTLEPEGILKSTVERAFKDSAPWLKACRRAQGEYYRHRTIDAARVNLKHRAPSVLNKGSTIHLIASKK